MIPNRIYLQVPFSEKDKAKELGARWDAFEKKWYCPDPDRIDAFSRWQEKKFRNFSELSDEQQEFVQLAKSGRNILVDACIGSGKTTAIQVLCNEMTDRKILYLTYNALLKIDAREKIRQRNVTVANYHSFALTCLRNSNIEIDGISDLIQLFLQKEPHLIRKYDLLVIDEYQDIELEIAGMLELIKKKCPGIQIVAVGDMKQKIYDKTTLEVPEFIDRFLGKHIVMSFTKCFRLSEAHAARLGRIWEKNIVGVNKNCKVETMSRYAVMDFLSKQKPSDILCLGSRNGTMSYVLNYLEENYSEKFNKQTVYASIKDEDRQAIAPSSSSAIFTTFDSSKGLERKICVIFDYTEDYWEVRMSKPQVKYEILRNIFLVAASRGKEHIIFVNSSKTEALSDKTISTPDLRETKFAPFLISEMFEFKYKEDVEECYKLIARKNITPENVDDINVNVNDELIDLSPCIGIWQEAEYFINYDIDAQIEFAKEHHKEKVFPKLPEDSSVDDKILLLTAIETNYNRYITQVKTPFIDDEQKNTILARLGKVFDGREDVQGNCLMRFMGSPGNILNICGRYDVLKNNIIYELKFKSELSHEDHLQLACYLVALEKEKGILWNVKTGTMYEITVPDKRKFLDAVAKCITKGKVKRFIEPSHKIN